LLILFVFFFIFSSEQATSGTVSNFNLLPFADPGISLFKLARDARFQAVLEEVDAAGTHTDWDRCSTDDRVLALLEMRGTTPLDKLSLRDGRSSLDARRTKSGLGSLRYRFVRWKLSKEM
jgi:hypothetical protein